MSLTEARRAEGIAARGNASLAMQDVMDDLRGEEEREEELWLVWYIIRTSRHARPWADMSAQVLANRPPLLIFKLGYADWSNSESAAAGENRIRRGNAL